MNEIVRFARSSSHSATPEAAPSQLEIEQSFRAVLRWIGEDPDRDGLRETPGRLVRAFQEYFSGYRQDPELILQKTFEETDGYDEMVVLRGVPFESHCEHHVAPIIGRAWVAYVPKSRVVGISKLARIVEAYSKRLQIQERLTAQIANTIDRVLEPQGVAVAIKAAHHCMSRPQGPQPTEMTGIEEARRGLPRAWKGFANFVMRQPTRRGQDREIDLAIIAPDRIILVDLKHLRGRFENRGSFWHRGDDPDRRRGGFPSRRLHRGQEHHPADRCGDPVETA